MRVPSHIYICIICICWRVDGYRRTESNFRLILFRLLCANFARKGINSSHSSWVKIRLDSLSLVGGWSKRRKPTEFKLRVLGKSLFKRWHYTGNGKLCGHRAWEWLLTVKSSLSTVLLKYVTGSKQFFSILVLPRLSGHRG